MFSQFTPLYCSLVHVPHTKGSYFLVTLGLNDIKDNEPSPPLLLLELKTDLKDTAATKLLEIIATYGQAKAKALPSFNILKSKKRKHICLKSII